MAEPRCPYFGRCGGCAAQHIDYELQLANKRQLLERAAGFAPAELFSDREYGYRTRMDMVFHEGGLGFRLKGVWHRVVDVEQCPISNETINRLIAEVRSFFREVDWFDLRRKSGTFRYAVIRAPQQDSSISFVLSRESTRLLEARERIAEFAKGSSARNVVVTYVPRDTDNSISDDFFVIKGGDQLEESYLGRTFRYSVQGFFQNNYEMALKLHQWVRALLEERDTGGHHLVDLYGGVGTFGIINADLFREVTIIESFAGSVEAAQANIQGNGIGNARAVCLDAMRLKNIELTGPLTVITDPPRSGMHPKTIQQLTALRPERLIYVSCNLKQLGIDLQKFSGFEVRRAALFDLFPHTPHCEGVVELVPKD